MVGPTTSKSFLESLQHCFRIDILLQHYIDIHHTIFSNNITNFPTFSLRVSYTNHITYTFSRSKYALNNCTCP